MEKLHLHKVHQLLLALADARKRNGNYTDESHVSQANSKDSPQYGQNNVKKMDSNGSGATNANTGNFQWDFRQCSTVCWQCIKSGRINVVSHLKWHC
ncbi:hypothetical protein V6N13_036561 [Hibiscus sabdariffa]|uniref:C2H2-type domain-containing protein n=1 Tax=Hibiscus sabdariffa TaxID=183260 RepID=A0ABR2S667_9ROSI